MLFYVFIIITETTDLLSLFIKIKLFKIAELLNNSEN